MAVHSGPPAGEAKSDVRPNIRSTFSRTKHLIRSLTHSDLCECVSCLVVLLEPLPWFLNPFGLDERAPAPTRNFCDEAERRMALPHRERAADYDHEGKRSESTALAVDERLQRRIDEQVLIVGVEFPREAFRGSPQEAAILNLHIQDYFASIARAREESPYAVLPSQIPLLTAAGLEIPAAGAPSVPHGFHKNLEESSLRRAGGLLVERQYVLISTKAAKEHLVPTPHSIQNPVMEGRDIWRYPASGLAESNFNVTGIKVFLLHDVSSVVGPHELVERLVNENPDAHLLVTGVNPAEALEGVSSFHPTSHRITYNTLEDEMVWMPTGSEAESYAQPISVTLAWLWTSSIVASNGQRYHVILREYRYGHCVWHICPGLEQAEAARTFPTGTLVKIPALYTGTFQDEWLNRDFVTKMLGFGERTPVRREDNYLAKANGLRASNGAFISARDCHIGANLCKYFDSRRGLLGTAGQALYLAACFFTLRWDAVFRTSPDVYELIDERHPGLVIRPTEGGGWYRRQYSARLHSIPNNPTILQQVVALTAAVSTALVPKMIIGELLTQLWGMPLLTVAANLWDALGMTPERALLTGAVVVLAAALPARIITALREQAAHYLRQIWFPGTFLAFVQRVIVEVVGAPGHRLLVLGSGRGWFWQAGLWATFLHELFPAFGASSYTLFGCHSVFLHAPWHALAVHTLATLFWYAFVLTLPAALLAAWLHRRAAGPLVPPHWYQPQPVDYEDGIIRQYVSWLHDQFDTHELDDDSRARLYSTIAVGLLASPLLLYTVGRYFLLNGLARAAPAFRTARSRLRFTIDLLATHGLCAERQQPARAPLPHIARQAIQPAVVVAAPLPPRPVQPRLAPNPARAPHYVSNVGLEYREWVMALEAVHHQHPNAYPPLTANRHCFFECVARVAGLTPHAWFTWYCTAINRLPGAVRQPVGEITPAGMLNFAAHSGFGLNTSGALVLKQAPSPGWPVLHFHLARNADSTLHCTTAHAPAGNATAGLLAKALATIRLVCEEWFEREVNGALPDEAEPTAFFQGLFPDSGVVDWDRVIWDEAVEASGYTVPFQRDRHPTTWNWNLYRVNVRPAGAPDEWPTLYQDKAAGMTARVGAVAPVIAPPTPVRRPMAPNVPSPRAPPPAFGSFNRPKLVFPPGHPAHVRPAAVVSKAPVDPVRAVPLPPPTDNSEFGSFNRPKLVFPPGHPAHVRPAAVVSKAPVEPVRAVPLPPPTDNSEPPRTYRQAAGTASRRGVVDERTKVAGPAPRVPDLTRVSELRTELENTLPNSDGELPMLTLVEDVFPAWRPNYEHAALLADDLKAHPELLGPEGNLSVAKALSCIADHHRRCETDRSVRLTLLLGVAGCGKTTKLLEILGRMDASARRVCRIVTHTAILRAELQQRVRAQFPELRGYNFPTLGNVLAQPTTGTIIFSDAGKYWGGILSLVVLTNPAITDVIVEGDPAQGRSPIPAAGTKTKNLPTMAEEVASFARHYATVSHRIPRLTADLLGLHTTSTTEGFVTNVTGPTGARIITSSPRYVQVLEGAGRSAITFMDAQGEELDAPIELDLTGLEGAVSDAVIYVGLTRSKVGTYLHTDPGASARWPVPPTGSQLLNAILYSLRLSQESTITTADPLISACFRAHLRKTLPSVAWVAPVGYLARPEEFHAHVPAAHFVPIQDARAADGCTLDAVSSAMAPLDTLDPELVPADSEARERSVGCNRTHQFLETAVVNPPKHKRGDQATMELSIEKRIRRATPEQNMARAAAQPRTDMIEMFDVLVPNCPDWAATGDELIDRAPLEYASGRSREMVHANLARHDPDRTGADVLLSLKAQTIKKVEKLGTAAIGGQLIHQYDIAQTLADGPFFRFLEEQLLPRFANNVHFYNRESIPEHVAAIRPHLTLGRGFTGSDVSGWDFGCDAGCLNFDVAVLQRCNLPSEFIEGYRARRLATRSQFGPMQTMQNSGDRGTWVMNSIRRAVLTAITHRLEPQFQHFAQTPSGRSYVSKHVPNYSPPAAGYSETMDVNGDDILIDQTKAATPFEDSDWVEKELVGKTMEFSGMSFHSDGRVTYSPFGLYYRCLIKEEAGTTDPIQWTAYADLFSYVDSESPYVTEIARLLLRHLPRDVVLSRVGPTLYEQVARLAADPSLQSWVLSSNLRQPPPPGRFRP